MKKVLIIASLILIIGIGAASIFAVPMVEILAGYSAKTLCSCHFVSKRPIESILKDELAIFPGLPKSTEVGENRISFSSLGITRTAVYRKDLGCTLLSEKKAEELSAPIVPAEKAALVAARPFEFPKDSIEYSGLAEVIEKAFQEPFPDKKVNTRAIVVIKNGKLLAEQYAPGFDENTPQMGWSMTKSVTNALIGILVKRGKLDIYQPAPIDDWHKRPDDPRASITIDHLLRMSSGLHFEEDYASASLANTMLWRKADAGKVAYSQELEFPIDTKWYYSSGTTNILSGIIRDQFANDDGYLNFPHTALFDKIGMSTAVMETDANGTFVGSSLMYASARDWAKFGQLYLQDGVWEGERILPEGWVDYSRERTPSSLPYGCYAAHFWTNALEDPKHPALGPRKWDNVPEDAYYASGFEGQTVMIIPSRDVVIVRLGQTLDRSAWDIGAFVGEVLKVL